MINFKVYSLLGLTVFFALLSFSGQAFGQNTGEIPSWVKQATEIWIDGQISDAEFLALIENVLEKIFYLKK